MSDALYENESYVVYIHIGTFTFSGTEYPKGYAVVNKDTAIVEILTPCLPDAKLLAAQSNKALKDAPWKWFDEPKAAAEEIDVKGLIQ